MEPFASTLRRIRIAAGLTQAQVATMVGRHANTVARWERGERTPGPLVREAVLARIRKETHSEGGTGK